MKLYQVLRLPGKITIYANRLNWVLEVGSPNNRSYFTSLDDLCDELFDLRLQMEASKSKKLKRDILSLRDAVQDARETMRKDLEVLETMMRNTDEARRKGLFDKERT